MKQTLLTASLNRIVSVQFRDRMGNLQKTHGRLMVVTNRIAIFRNMKTKNYKMVLVDSISVIKAKKQTTEFPSIIPVQYAPTLGGFRGILMNIQAPQFIPSF